MRLIEQRFVLLHPILPSHPVKVTPLILHRRKQAYLGKRDNWCAQHCSVSSKKQDIPVDLPDLKVTLTALSPLTATAIWMLLSDKQEDTKGFLHCQLSWRCHYLIRWQVFHPKTPLASLRLTRGPNFSNQASTCFTEVTPPPKTMQVLNLSVTLIVALDRYVYTCSSTCKMPHVYMLAWPRVHTQDR